MEMASRVMSLVLLISMGYLCSSQTFTFYVGGDQGWIPHPSHISYSRWAEMNRFQINDTLVFKYKKGSVSVLVVTKDDYERCNKDGPLQVFKDGNSEFKFHKSGPFFFISGRTQNCEKGQKLVTVVLSDRHHNASPAPSPVPPTHSPPLKPPPSQSPPPSSHHAPAPTPHPTHAPPPLSTISAPPGKAPQPASPTRSPIPSPSPHHQAPTSPVTPTQSPPTSHSPPPSTPKIPPLPSPAAHLAPSPSPKAESPKKGDDGENHHHPAPSPHASSPEYPHHAPAPAPSAAPCLSASFSLFVGIFSLGLSILSSSIV